MADLVDGLNSSKDVANFTDAAQSPPSGTTVVMTSVVFIQNAPPYRSGEVAAFAQAMADRLVATGVARYGATGF